MGLFEVTIELGDPAGQGYEPVDAVVDTGALYTIVPSRVPKRLGVKPHTRTKFILASGREYERDIGQTWARVDGRSVITLVLFGNNKEPPVLGAYTLEGVGLGVDPVNRRLTPVSGFLLTMLPHA
jgi:clan AA aspartic protease